MTTLPVDTIMTTTESIKMMSQQMIENNKSMVELIKTYMENENKIIKMLEEDSRNVANPPRSGFWAKFFCRG